MTLRDALIKKIDVMTEEQLAWMLQTAEDLLEPDEEEATPEELASIDKGKEEFERSECISWEDLKKKLGRA